MEKRVFAFETGCSTKPTRMSLPLSALISRTRYRWHSRSRVKGSSEPEPAEGAIGVEAARSGTLGGQGPTSLVTVGLSIDRFGWGGGTTTRNCTQ